MGLTSSSVGVNVLEKGFCVKKEKESDVIVALSGNPNVGKSSIFNILTGLRQHTGNWPGKTVTNAVGKYNKENVDYIVVDIPGTYSLNAASKEEEVARNFMAFGNADVTVVVCDATCLERNFILLLQTLEMGVNTVLCINLIDEAKKKGIFIDTKKLSRLLGIPVVAVSAKKGENIDQLTDEIQKAAKCKTDGFKLRYSNNIEEALCALQIRLKEILGENKNIRWIAVKLLENNENLIKDIEENLGEKISQDSVISCIIENTDNKEKELMSKRAVEEAEKLYLKTTKCTDNNYNLRDKKIDKILTGKFTAVPVMLLMLGVIFWITITGANYPSSILNSFFSSLEEPFYNGLIDLGASKYITEMIVYGCYRVLYWVVSVMLPPMAIFFPLFTLLEDMGVLPRIAFNLDGIFKKCGACGKQSLTTAMGFGCNCAGVIGCRIIDSPRERFIAIVTNSFIPCNGRFPTIIAVITMFFVPAATSFGSVFSAVLVLAVIVFGILMSFLASKILSSTLLKGKSSSFILEMPPYRIPNIGNVVIRSVFDRTIFVLGRAVAVAAPAGIVIWLMANTYFGGESLLNIVCGFLEPLGSLMGLDGAILTAFLLGFPANEIVVPIIMMIYASSGTLTEFDDVMKMREILVSNGWDFITALNMMLFSIMHFPCSSTCLTIKKETGSFKWTLISFLLPLIFGITICIFTNFLGSLIGL